MPTVGSAEAPAGQGDGSCSDMLASDISRSGWFNGPFGLELIQGPMKSHGLIHGSWNSEPCGWPVFIAPSPWVKPPVGDFSSSRGVRTSGSCDQDSMAPSN